MSYMQSSRAKQVARFQDHHQVVLGTDGRAKVSPRETFKDRPATTVVGVCTIPPVWVPHSPSVRAGPIRDRLFFRRITRVQKSWEKVARPGLLIKQLRIWVVVASGPFLVSPPQYPPWACTHVTQGSNLAFSSDFCLPRAEGPDHLNDGLHPALLPLFSLPPFL